MYTIMKKGGNYGASGYGDYLWGQNQNAVPGSGNLIQAVGNPNDFKGGSRNGGSGILTTAAVPAVLLAANHLYKRKRKNRSKKRIIGGEGNMMSSLMNAQLSSMNQMQQIQSQLLPQTPSGTIISSTTETGSQTMKYGGNGLIETVAVPAVLLTANHLYRPLHKPRKSFYKKTQKRGKRSRRFSMKKR